MLGDRALACSREQLDVRDKASVERVLAEQRPDVVINAAAYNAVDAAEAEPAEALSVNATGPAHLARACRTVGTRLVHVSTDYVFDGTATSEPYPEDAPPRPIGFYGASKLAGELMVAASGCDYLIVRTSGVIGAGGSRAKGGSFVERILAKARSGESLRVVNDQVFAPTFAPDLARGLLALVTARASGLFHVTNTGACSWYELAVAALGLAQLDVQVTPVTTAELSLAARRPAYSVLSNARYLGLGLPPLRPWREALAEMLR